MVIEHMLDRRRGDDEDAAYRRGGERSALRDRATGTPRAGGFPGVRERSGTASRFPGAVGRAERPRDEGDEVLGRGADPPRDPPDEPSLSIAERHRLSGESDRRGREEVART
jgi:hypothetical protein